MKKICTKCNKNIIKNFYAKICSECYIQKLKSSHSWNFKGASICECGERKAWHAKKCRKCAYPIGLPKCKGCENKLSVYKNSKNFGTGYCQKCYRGKITKRWNNNLSTEFRLKGRTVNPEYTIWRDKVFKRDDYTCKKCGDNRGGNLIAHHIKNFCDDESARTDIKNGITLCTFCHGLFHGLWNYKKNTNQELLTFLII